MHHSRSFSYDRAGLRTGFSHPGGDVTLSYNARGLPTQVAGGAGTTTYVYDAASRVTERTDAAGAHTFTWTPRGELDTAHDPITGTDVDYGWDDASQLVSVDYGTATRTLAYDDLGHMSADTLSDGATVAAHTYTYDADGNPLTQAVTLPGNAGSGTHTYAYDRMGRLASWTAPGASATAYAYDDAGNRTGNGADSYTYDARNRLVASPEGTHTYDRRGTMRSIDTGSSVLDLDFDALGRLATSEATDYAYDALDRIATREGTNFAYPGTLLDPATDGVSSFSRTPGGRLLGVETQGQDALAGMNAHGDLAYLFDAGGTLSSTTTYEPFGEVLDRTGSDPALSFQGDYTDPDSDHVWMGARWYAPTWDAFLSRDTMAGELKTPVTLNRYTYANANPLAFFDPDGRFACRRGSLCDRVGAKAGAPASDRGTPAASAPTKPKAAKHRSGDTKTGNDQRTAPRKPSYKCIPVGAGGCYKVRADSWQSMTSDEKRELVKDVADLHDNDGGALSNLAYGLSHAPGEILAAADYARDNPGEFISNVGGGVQSGANAGVGVVDRTSGWILPGRGTAIGPVFDNENAIGGYAFGEGVGAEALAGEAAGLAAVSTIKRFVQARRAVQVGQTATSAIETGTAPASAGSVAGSAQRATSWVDDAPAPIGRRGSPIEIAPGTNSPGAIGGRQYTGHALDRMQGRGIMPSAVDDAIATSRGVTGADGSIIHYSPTNNISVVLNTDGSVRTVSHGVFKPK